MSGMLSGPASVASDWRRMLSEMEQLKAKSAVLQSRTPLVPESGTRVDTGFGGILSQALDAVNADLVHADKLATGYEKGQKGIDLPDVAIAAKKADVTLQAAVQVRNKLMEAYKEIMNMPV